MIFLYFKGGDEILSLSTVVVMNQKYTSVGDKTVVTPSSNGVYFEEETIQTSELLLFPAGGLNSNNNELCEEEWKNLISHLVAPNGLTYPEVIALDSELDIRDGYGDGKWWCLRRCDRIHVMILSFIKNKECLNFDMLVYRHQSSIYKPLEHLALIQ